MKMSFNSFEICIVDHCNLSCGNCNHFSPYFKEHFLPLNVINRDVQTLKSAIFSEEIRILGGEPLLHPDLAAILDSVRNAGISEKITIISNGTLLNRMPDTVWERIDRLWINSYPGISFGLDDETILKKAKEHAVGVWKRDVRSFSMIALNQINADHAWVRKVYDSCCMAHAWNCYQIREGYIYKCCVAPYISHRLSYLGISLDNRRIDGVPIHDNVDLETDLVNYINSKDPLKACYYCLGSIGRRMGHHQLCGKGIKEELAKDHSDIVSLVSKSEYWKSKMKIFLGRSNIFHSTKKWFRFSNL